MCTGCCKISPVRLHFKEQRKCAILNNVHKGSWIDRKYALATKTRLFGWKMMCLLPVIARLKLNANRDRLKAWAKILAPSFIARL